MVVFCLVWLFWVWVSGLLVWCGGGFSVGYTSSGGVFPLGWVIERGGRVVRPLEFEPSFVRRRLICVCGSLGTGGAI